MTGSATIGYLETGQVELSTPRLLMRGAQLTDSPSLHEAFKDPEVTRYWSTLPHSSVAQTEEWVQKMVQSPLNGVTDFIICLRPDLLPVGKIGVWQEQEIGFLLARKCWRQGLAQEALRAIISYLFERKNLDEITADTDPENAASIGILKKLGFAVYDYKEKTMEIGGVWVDSLYLKLTRDQWSTRQEAHQTPAGEPTG